MRITIAILGLSLGLARSLTLGAASPLRQQAGELPAASTPADAELLFAAGDTCEPIEYDCGRALWTSCSEELLICTANAYVSWAAGDCCRSGNRWVPSHVWVDGETGKYNSGWRNPRCECGDVKKEPFRVHN